MMPCPRCLQTGHVYAAGNRVSRPCPSCEGRGVITESMATQDDADREIARLEADVTALRLLVGEWYATHVKDTPPTVGLVERTRETLR